MTAITHRVVRADEVRLRLWRNRDFGLRISGRVVLFAGSQVQMFVVPLLVLAISRLATAAGLVMSSCDDGARPARPRRARTRLPGLAVTVGCLAGLAWLVVGQHDQLGRAIARMSHANPGLIVAAVACEWVSMVSFARMQRRLLLAGGQHLAIVSAAGIAFAGNAVSVSVPVAGSGLGTAFTYRQFRRHRVSDAAAALALLVSGVLSTLSLMAVMAVGALMSGNTVAGAVGALWATACVAGVAGLVLGLRKPA